MVTDGFSSSSYQVDNKNYSVIESGAKPIPTNNKEYQYSIHNRVLIQHAIKKVMGHFSVKPENVNLLVTLPVGQFFNSDGSRNCDLINKKIKNINGDILSLDNADLIKISNCYVMPEGIPAYNHVKNSINSTGTRDLMVDIGGTTTDLVIITDGNQVENFKSANIGVLETIQRFSLLACERLQLTELTDSKAHQGLFNGLVIGCDVSDISSRVIDEFKSLVNEQVTSMGELKTFDTVMYSGGGACFLDSSEVDIIKSDTPQFDNCIGGLDILEVIING
jgi:hypothetical protein